MEINPYVSRLRMLQQRDAVQMQREATPDEETAGCPGCPFFWTCPVPHHGEEVRAPEEIVLEDVQETLGPRREFSPRDESDIGWTDVWLDDEGLPIDRDEAAAADAVSAGAELADTELPPERADGSGSAASVPPEAPAPRRRGLFRRRR